MHNSLRKRRTRSAWPLSDARKQKRCCQAPSKTPPHQREASSWWSLLSRLNGLPKPVSILQRRSAGAITFFNSALVWSFKELGVLYVCGRGRGPVPETPYVCRRTDSCVRNSYVLWELDMSERWRPNRPSGCVKNPRFLDSPGAGHVSNSCRAFRASFD